MANAEKVSAVPTDKFDIEKFNVVLSVEDVARQNSMAKTNPDRNKLPFYASTKYIFKEGGKPEELIVLTKEISMVSGGIPKNTINQKTGEPFYKSEKERSFLKLPVDDKQSACLELKNVVDSIDKYMEDNKDKVLAGIEKKKRAEYKYSPLRKVPSDEVKEKSTSTLYDTVKAVFDYKRECDSKKDDEGTLKLVVIVKQPNGKMEMMEVEKLTDVEKYVTYECKLKCAICISHLWVTKSKILNVAYMYGIKVKCVQIIITEPGRGNKKNRSYSASLFDEDEDLTPVEKTQPKKVKSPEPESDKDSDADSEDEKPKAKVAPKKVKSPEPESDKDSDVDSEDEKPKAKAKAKAKVSPKKVKSPEPESDESSEEEKKPVKKTTKPKKVSSDEEDD